MWLPHNQALLKVTQNYWEDGQGYYAIQSTRPQTLAYSLADSPVGLLAWIYEKLITWTDSYPWTDDEGNVHTQLLLKPWKSSSSELSVLTWVCLYWFSRSGPDVSLRIYYEATHSAPVETKEAPYTSIPTGFSYFEKEIVAIPKS